MGVRLPEEFNKNPKNPIQDHAKCHHRAGGPGSRRILFIFESPQNKEKDQSFEKAFIKL
jgi:hypothetical protein